MTHGVGELVRACAELAEDSGLWSDGSSPSVAPRRREDYALAAGPDHRRSADAIARGTNSVNWVAVPPGIFDAADGTIDWSVRVADSAVVARVDVAVTGEVGARGVEVRFQSGTTSGAGFLDANATALLELFGRVGGR